MIQPHLAAATVTAPRHPGRAGSRSAWCLGFSRRIAVAASAAIGLFGAAPAMAEGSRSMYPAGYAAAYSDGGRAGLGYDPTDTPFLNKVRRRTFIYVYAKEGEYILAGSSNRAAAGTGSIRFFTPQPTFGQRGDETIPASAALDCSSGTTGQIATRAQELAGPQAVTGGGNAAGYQPCAYLVPSGGTGIYGIFFGPGASSDASNQTIATFGQSTNSVPAWDVTVRSGSTSTTDIDGRVFTYAVAISSGGNGSGHRIYSDLYYVTSDGYRYRQALQGIDPNRGVFFASPLGFRDQGQPLYKDIRGNSGAVATFPAGVTADDPSYPVFFSNVAPGGAPGVEETLTALNIPLAPKPPQVNSFSFSYPPASSSTSYLGQGGTFNFFVTDTISYQIVISRDGVDFDPATSTNRVITGVSGTGSYSVTWDGKDNAGNNFPVGNDYRFRITGRSGEVHFPFADVEGNINGGPIVTKLNGGVMDSIVYYDDRGYVTRSGATIGTPDGHICAQPTWPQPTPPFALAGIDSSAQIYKNNTAFARWWPDSGSNTSSDCSSINQYFGDAKALNLWTYQTTQPQANTFNIIDAADVRATISAPVSTSAGSGVTLNIGFGNVGSRTADGISYSAKLPSGLGGVACSGATCNYDGASGLVTITGLPLSLSAGQSVNLSLSYIAPPSGNVNVVANVGTSTSQGPNLAPDSASATTLVGGTSNADVLTSVMPPPSSVVGGTVTVPVNFANVGSTSAPITNYALQLTPGLANVACSSGVTCNYNSATGAVALSGLPAALAPGQSAPFSLTYTAPAAGTPVTVTSTVATSASEANTTNNTASATTTTLGIGSKPDVVATVAAPTTATPGSLVSVPVTFGNVGDIAAAGLTYGLTLPTGLTGVSCPAPAVCTYNAGTGAVGVSGLPAALTSGSYTSLTLRYNAPSSGVVPATANIATTTAGEANTANNSATGNTTVVTASSGADVTAAVNAPANSGPGVAVNVPITFANQGPQAAAGVTYSLNLPPGLSGVSCAPAAVTCAYNAANGTITLTGLPTTLTSGQTVPFTLTYTAPTTGQVPVNAAVQTTTFDPNNGNNTASGTTAVGASGSQADVTTAVSPPPTAVSGAIVNVPVSFSNVGSVAADGVTYNVALTGSPSSVTVTNGGVACSYSSGAITGCGLPASLTPGQSVNLTVSYTAPATGPVGITSTVGTTTAESNAANNTATASTTLTLPPAPDLAISLANLPGTATAGSPYSGSFACTNGGTASATAGTSCTVSGLPAGITVGACTISPSNTTWNAGNAVPAGQTVTCTVSGTPTTAGSSTVTGSTGATGDGNTANNSASAPITVNPAAADANDLLTTVQPPPSAVSGSSVVVPVTFANVGATSVPVTSYGLQLAPGLTGAVTCSGSGASCTYDAASGAVTISGLPGGIAAGRYLPLTLSYTAPAAGTTVTVDSSIATSVTEGNTANNTASGSTTTLGTGNKPDVLASIAAPTTATPGSTVGVPVRFGNVGDVTAASLTYGLTLPGGLSGVACSAPAICSYNPSTGAVAVSGLPASLAPGAYASLTLNYTAPATGVVPATATIGTGTPGETNTVNNSATGKTTLAAAAPTSGADVAVTVTAPANAVPGAVVNVPVVVRNAGPATAADVRYGLNLPTGLSGVTCTPATTVTCSYNAATGVVTLSGLPTSLASQQSVPFTLSYTAPATGQVPVNATIQTSTFDPDSNNNASSGTTTFGQADVNVSVAAPASAQPGTAVDVPVTFGNAGGVAAADVSYRVTLTGSPTGVTVSNGGIACGYDSANGAVTGCALPTTLAPGQSIGLVVRFTTPASGTVRIDATIGTSTSESSTVNNTASGSTTVAPATPVLTPDMGIDLRGLPETATVGVAYNGSFSCTNGGTGPATSGTLCNVTGLPAGVTAGPCSIAGSTWTAGASVAVGQTVRCTVSGTPTAVGASTITGTTGAAGDVNAANNSATRRVTVAAAAEPAVVQPIPTLSEWAFLLLGGLLAMLGAAGMTGRGGRQASGRRR